MRWRRRGLGVRCWSMCCGCRASPFPLRIEGGLGRGTRVWTWASFVHRPRPPFVKGGRGIFYASPYIVLPFTYCLSEYAESDFDNKRADHDAGGGLKDGEAEPRAEDSEKTSG